MFGLSFFLGLLLHDKISLPFSNPWDIKGPLVVARYNPFNDVARFVFLISLPSFMLIVSCLVGRVRRFLTLSPQQPYHFSTSAGCHGLLFKMTWICVFVAVVVASGNTFRSGPLDTFHEGETLGPSIDYLHGKIPYKDSIFIHGPFRDPLRSAIAFSLFGKCIGAVRTLDSVLHITTNAFFLMAFYLLYKRNIFYASLSAFALFTVGQTRPFGILFHLGLVDIAFLVLVIATAFLEGQVRSNMRNGNRGVVYISLFCLTFVPTVSFANSVDRGYCLSAASFLFLFLVYVLFMRGQRWRALFAMLGGYGLGILVLGISIKWAYADFFNYVFLVLPRLAPLMNGVIYPFKNVRFLIPVVCLGGVLYWVALRFISLQMISKASFWEKTSRFFAGYFIEIFLLLLSLTCYRRALGRADLGHLGDVIGPIAILLIYVFVRHGMAPLFERMKEKEVVLSAAALIVTILFLGVAVHRTNWATWYRFPLKIEDRQLIPENYLATISFLKEQLRPEEDFLTMTSEGIWYYFLDKACPIRFQVVYQAMPPFYQKEIVEDLRKKNVKFVLYRNSHWANDIDGFDTSARLPIVMKYLNNEFRFFRKIDDNEIWIRK